MKQCPVCKESYQPVSRDKGCSACREKASKRVCRNCKKPFVAKHPWRPQEFCTSACAGQHMLTDPTSRTAFYTQARLQKIMISRRAVPGQMERIAKAMHKGLKNWRGNLTEKEKLEFNAKISQRLKAAGHCPKVRGGNGTGPTKAEWQLMRMFPEGIWNYPVKTGKWNGSGIPPVYKLDLGFPNIKLGIEVDGLSHCALERKAKDVKKTNCLKELGWTVLRYTNKQVLDFRVQVQILADIESTISMLSPTTATP